ncbi:hypothetical protein [Mesorhizobium sp. M0207]|uniref:hypothetical protein n=1 Tax=Mesorhizobium sp. M0207 TaxID=2956915 RepID=UPI003336BBDC
MSSNDNRRKALGDVVTVDAWHKQFSEGNGIADLHVDVVFSTARVGGERESKISFRLSLRRAELVLHAKATEPLKIDKSSVSRELRSVEVKQTLQKDEKKSAAVKASAAASASSKSVGVRGRLEVSAAADVSVHHKINVTEKLSIIAVKQSKTHDGHYRWDLTPSAAEILEGRPWDPIKSPRAKLIDTRSDRSRGIPPTVSIEVRCLREDMLITDIQIKDENIWQKIRGKSAHQNRIAAAESFIKDKLVEEGLEFSDIEDRFGLITLVDVVAEPEG